LRKTAITPMTTPVMASMTTSDVPKRMFPMWKFEVGSTLGNTRNSAVNVIWETLSRICETA